MSGCKTKINNVTDSITLFNSHIDYFTVIKSVDEHNNNYYILGRL